jgi:glycosyltransferase involved in cell wall biosynthesis
VSGKKNILAITYWSFKEALVQTYTLPYLYIILEQLPAGSRIYLVTLEQKNLRMTSEEKKKVRKKLKSRGIFLISFKYYSFGIVAIFKWATICIQLFFLTLLKNIRVIHAWCTPAATIGYLMSILTRRKLVVDSYEPHAESMVENKTWSRKSVAFKILFFLEKKISHHAHIVIAPVAAMQNYAQEKYSSLLSRFYIKPACVDLQKFSPLKRKNRELVQHFGFEGKIVCVYAGKFGGIYLTKEVFDFFRVAELHWGDKFRVIVLSATSSDLIYEWAREAGFNSEKIIVQFIPNELIADYIGLGDFAINPVKPVPSKRYCTSIKDGEYWAMGLPVVITDGISDDTEIILENNIGAVIKNFAAENYLQAVIKIESLIEEDEKSKTEERILEVANKYRSYEIARSVYKKIYLEEN